ncbi:MAG: TRAP transporter small permease subunit, partial [Mesorhizobium sp.]
MAAASNNTMIVDTPAEVLDARPGSRLMWPVEAVASILLVFLIGLLLAGVISRYVLSLPIVWIDEAASISFLWLAMLGSAIAIDRNEHLRLTIFLNLIPERGRPFVNALALLLVATVLLVLIVPASQYV